MAIEVFKKFEKNERELLDRAATNLAFVYFLEGDLESAERYSERAVGADRYNARARVTRANCHYARGEFDRARDMYREALGVESDCTEALYNLGLVYKRLGDHAEAVESFKKLHRLVPNSPEVIYCIANILDMLGETQSSLEWFKILHGLVPDDPTVLARMGTLCRKEEDDTQAFHNYLDSYRAYPVNMEIISWLGVWYVNSEMYEEAIRFFERAAEIEPRQVKWKLMVASCYRRMREFGQAVGIYKQIHRQDPDNIECLQYLCAICKETNEDDYEEYSKKLRNLQRTV
eukprot:322283_1